jgi:hypothetical protein
LDVLLDDMNFSKRKLPIEATSQLRQYAIDTVKPYALMAAPVYVFMRRNQKFISVKAPLDFFTEQELEKLRSCDSFFMPQFIDTVMPYRDLARRVKMILGWNPVETKATLPPASFELADGVLRTMAPVWGNRHRIEPFFAAVFTNEFCDLLPGEDLKSARERDCELFERAVIISSWMVFLSLHIGVADQQYMNALRLSVFRKVMGDEQDEGTSIDSRSDAGELFQILQEVLVGENIHQSLGIGFFETRSERVSQKIVARLNRVRENLSGASLSGTIYGERGFVDV